MCRDTLSDAELELTVAAVVHELNRVRRCAESGEGDDGDGSEGELHDGRMSSGSGSRLGAGDVRSKPSPFYRRRRRVLLKFVMSHRDRL